MHNESCDFVKNPESFSACTNFMKEIARFAELMTMLFRSP